jgi:hypothetical protein
MEDVLMGKNREDVMVSRALPSSSWLVVGELERKTSREERVIAGLRIEGWIFGMRRK